MFGDVNVKVEDGNLGRGASTTGTGAHVKIGVSNIVSTQPIMVKGSMDNAKIRELLGDTPLADACMDSTEWGSDTIYAIPVAATTNGTISEVVETKTGTGTFAVAGHPNNEYSVIFKIAESGEKNEATFQYSTDGGKTYSEEAVVPLQGDISLENTGLSVTLTEATAVSGSFVAGDTFTFTTTAPAMSNESVIAAVESLINKPIAFEFIHIVGASGKALWSSLATEANDFLTRHKKPLYFVCEARTCKTDEELAEYVDAMLQERKGINNIYVQVCCSHSRYQRKDGRVMIINNAGIVCGLYGRAKMSQSIGEVKNFPISEAKILQLLPEGIEDYLPQLDTAKYLTIRQYQGREDYYVTNANMMSPEGSDYQYAEDVRVSNHLVKAVRQRALGEMQVEIDPGEIETSLAIIQEKLNTPIEEAVRDKIISSGRAEIIRENLNILADEELNVHITHVPMGHVRAFNLTFAVENPYKAQ